MYVRTERESICCCIDAGGKSLAFCVPSGVAWGFRLQSCLTEIRNEKSITHCRCLNYGRAAALLRTVHGRVEWSFQYEYEFRFCSTNFRCSEVACVQNLCFHLSCAFDLILCFWGCFNKMLTHTCCLFPIPSPVCQCTPALLLA